MVDQSLALNQLETLVDKRKIHGKLTAGANAT